MRKDTSSLTAEAFSARRKRRLSAFQRPWRSAIGRISRRRAAIEDLADSFPALLFALATGYGTEAQRRQSMAAILAGRPLKVAAGCLDLPMWLRRIPSFAFREPLPVIPSDPEFGTAMSNRLPTHPDYAATWFGRIVDALRIVGRDFAIWVAKDFRLQPWLTNDDDFAWLTAWAWHSKHPEAPGHQYLRRPWSLNMPWKKAREEIAIWRKRLDLAATLGPGIRDAWAAESSVLGYDFVALRTAQQFIAESEAMENCLDQYARHLIYGHVRVFSIRRKGRSVANIELAAHPDDSKVLGIAQLRGRRNGRVSTHIWRAAQSWLVDQPYRRVMNEPMDVTATREALHTIWKPYLNVLHTAGVDIRLAPRHQPLIHRDPRSPSLAVTDIPAPAARVIRRAPQVKRPT